MRARHNLKLKKKKRKKRQAPSAKLQAPSKAKIFLLALQPVVVLFILLTTIPSHRPSVMDNPTNVKKFI